MASEPPKGRIARRPIEVHLHASPYDIVVVRGQDVRPDECDRIVNPVENERILQLWLEQRLGHGRSYSRSLVDVVRVLDGRLPWGFGPPDRGIYAQLIASRLARGLESGELVGLRYEAGWFARFRGL